MDAVEKFQLLIEDGLERLRGELNDKPRELFEPLNYMLSLGGKRVRPLLTLFACDLFDGDVSSALNQAIAIELFHNFSLIHDDIMDNAPLRRGMPTVHQKWNNNIAILSGDALLVKAYQYVCKGGSGQVMEIFNEMALNVCKGQQWDMNFEKKDQVSIAEYVRMIELKTADLLAASLGIGALMAGARKEDAERVFEFGKNIGIAFQLQDDMLDAYGKEDKFGKQKGGDIIANKKTYLLIKALELSKHNAYKKEELYQWIYSDVHDGKQKVEAVTAIYDFLNVKNLTTDEMKRYYLKGISCLDGIPVNKEKKENLIRWIEGLVNREL